jgi:hypothetical protein
VVKDIILGWFERVGFALDGSVQVGGKGKRPSGRWRFKSVGHDRSWGFEKNKDYIDVGNDEGARREE